MRICKNIQDNSLYGHRAYSGQECIIAGRQCAFLVGLASFAAEQRTKEIGVRKAIGASVPQILILLSRDFAVLVGIAFVIAAPIGYYALTKWLESFAFRIDLTVWLFLGAGLATIVAALATVMYQSLKAARIDPASSLRME